MKKILNLLLVSALAVSMQNCDDLLDLLGITIGVGGSVSDTSGAGISGATVTAYSITDNADAVDADGLLDVNALHDGQSATTSGNGSFTLDLNPGAYVIVTEADCYSTVVSGIRDDRNLQLMAEEQDFDDAIVVADGETALDVTLGGGCDAVTPEGGSDAGAADPLTADGAWTGFAVDGDETGPVALAEGDVVNITGTYGGATDPAGIVLVVDVGSGSEVYRTTVPVGSSSVNTNYKVISGTTTTFTLALEDESGELSEASAGIEVNAGGEQPALTAIMSWDASNGDLDFHAIHTGLGEEIYYGNKSPEWGLLDIDDTSGYGPETITITDAAAAVSFMVEAYSCPSEPTTVTFQIFEAGSDRPQVFTFDDWAEECEYKGIIEFGTFGGE